MAPPARQRILHAATRLLRERGLARLTTREIAMAADAAEGSITKNFGGKTGLLIAVLSAELPELRAWQAVATEPGERPVREVLIDLVERGIDYYAASLPLVAGALADQELFVSYRRANVRNGTGPQLAIEQMTTYFEACEVDTDPYTLAIMICGAAQIQAYTEHIGGPDALRGSRRERVTAVVDALAF